MLFSAQDSMIVFSKVSYFLFLIFMCFISVFPVSAQETENSIVEDRMLKDLYKYNNNDDAEEAHINHHRVLKEAIQFPSLIVELNSYMMLAKDHATGDLGERKFDSMIHYLDRFESKIVLFDADELQRKNILDMVIKYYTLKGFLLGNYFGLNQPSLESHLKAETYFSKTKNIDLKIRHAFLLTRIYNAEGKYDKSIKLLDQRLKDTIHMRANTQRQFYLYIALAYQHKKMPEQSFYYNSKALALAKKEKLKHLVFFIKNRIAYDYFLFGDYQKAIDSALVVREYYTTAPKRRILGLNNTARNLSDFYYAIGNIDKAIEYSKSQLNLINSSITRKIVLTKLAKYALKKNDYKSAMEYYRKKDNITDSVRVVEKDLLIKYNASNMKLIRQQHINENIRFENQLLEKNNEQQKLYIIMISSVLLILLLLLGGFFLYKKYKQSKKVVSVLKANEKELLQEQIRLRDNELDASAIAMAQKVEVLNTIKKELESIKDENPKLAKVNKTVRSLIRSSSDISLVTDRIESQYPTLTIELKNKHPELSTTEIRYCLLTKLNLSLKETAAMLNVTPNTVKVTRSRLKKKMSIYQDVSLKEYLDTIYINTATSA
ncbi:MAG: hypothetical protein AB8B65_04565 [Kordia sp.]|uniref:tetratricopeptide repeat protein n=1 Tax=Kordia sp. TaxID=1965332 RepID=UPI00385A01A5